MIGATLCAFSPTFATRSEWAVEGVNIAGDQCRSRAAGRAANRRRIVFPDEAAKQRLIERVVKLIFAPA
jgi:hypothetical protein